MSAWLVSKRHIDAIVTALADGGIIRPTPEACEAVGDMLWRENVASLAYRYPRDRQPDLLYRFERYALNDLWTLVKQLDCYDYQSCEHPGWSQSDAAALTDRLRRRTLATLGAPLDGYKNAAGWDAAPWGID